MRPPIQPKQAEQIILENYGLDAKVLTEFKSFGDRNYLLEVRKECIDIKKGDKFVFKAVFIPENGEEYILDYIKVQQKVMQNLKSSGINCCCPLHGKGDPMIIVLKIMENGMYTVIILCL